MEPTLLTPIFLLVAIMASFAGAAVTAFVLKRRTCQRGRARPAIRYGRDTRPATPPSIEIRHNAGLRCVLCRSEVEADDIMLPDAQGHCICFRCYLREAGPPSRMPVSLQRELEDCLKISEPGSREQPL